MIARIGVLYDADTGEAVARGVGLLEELFGALWFVSDLRIPDRRRLVERRGTGSLAEWA